MATPRPRIDNVANAVTGGGPSDAVPAHDSVVIYVHGVGAQPDAAALKLRWDLALFGRDLGERSRMAYWADILQNERRAVVTPARRSGADAKGRGSRGLDLDVLLGTQAPAGVTAFSQALVAVLGGPGSALAEPVGPARDDAVPGGPRKKVLPLPRWARRPLSRAFLEAFVQDTAAYFFVDGVRAAMQARLRAQLDAAAGRSVTIVAHSHGSIVAYELLAALPPNAVPIDAFITLGSPLGIQEVQDHLSVDDCAVPAVVRRWHNVADAFDVVALDQALDNDFTPNLDDVRIHDHAITNATRSTADGFNAHSAVNYLANPQVRRLVTDAMRLDPMARFVMARDVADKLGHVPTQRHPVLIEALEPGYQALGETRAQRQQSEAAETQGAGRDDRPVTLPARIDRLATQLAALVADPEAARIDPLRRFVAARLTADELQAVAARHRDLRVYAMWQSARKVKLVDARSLAAVKADAAQAAFQADGRGVTWAVLDTGLQGDHPHFAANDVTVYDCTQPGAPRRMLQAEDPDGHGTHVAGIIAGTAAAGVTGPNGEPNLRSMAPQARLVVYKVLDDDGHGEDAWIIKAIDHIAQQNDDAPSGMAIHGVNLSLGGPFDATVYGCGFSPICAELRRLWRDGVLVVVACGNEGQLLVSTPGGSVQINTAMSVGDPANLEECIAVGAVNADRPHLYGISPFSSRGPTADGRAKPDVVAPGERILSCNAQWQRDGAAQYLFESGTSMAAPHVSGLLAAFLSVRREFVGRPDEVKALLLRHCNDLGRNRDHQGHGLPNLMQMLLAV